jgi:hypothetical protein
MKEDTGADSIPHLDIRALAKAHEGQNHELQAEHINPGQRSHAQNHRL